MYNFIINIKVFIFGLLLKKSAKEKCHSILLTNNYDYYVSLNPKRKKQFVVRILLFLKNIEFSSSSDFNLDLSKKIKVAAAFAQISFGLNFFWLTFFKEMCIVSQSYSYKHTDDLYDGDVNLVTKKINMSWPAIEQGFKIADDALNLCIHELGHAMYFENLKRPSNDKYLFNDELKEWKVLALEKMQKIDANKNIVLRDYAGANLMEFFSVSLETFFEKPLHFKENEPALFDCMVNMFNQNPLNIKDPLNLEI